VERLTMTSSAAASVYRIFKRAEGAAPVRSIVIAMAIAAASLTAVGVIRVQRQHDVLRLGYQLDREAELVQKEREVKRRLEVELATLTAPERIRKLATQLGMTTVAPDKIRIVDVPSRKKVAAQ
jgi:cell division protein FtsL